MGGGGEGVSGLWGLLPPGGASSPHLRPEAGAEEGGGANRQTGEQQDPDCRERPAPPCPPLGPATCLPFPAEPSSNLSFTGSHAFHLKPEFKAFQGGVGEVQRLLEEFSTVVRTVAKLACVLHVLETEIT